MLRGWVTFREGLVEREGEDQQTYAEVAKYVWLHKMQASSLWLYTISNL